MFSPVVIICQTSSLCIYIVCFRVIIIPATWTRRCTPCSRFRPFSIKCCIVPLRPTIFRSTRRSKGFSRFVYQTSNGHCGDLVAFHNVLPHLHLESLCLYLHFWSLHILILISSHLHLSSLVWLIFSRGHATLELAVSVGR